MVNEAKYRKKENKLSPKQELFCRYFASDREFFGNGARAYIEAYGIDISKPGAYAGARDSAYRLLTNANIFTRVDENGRNSMNMRKSHSLPTL